MVPVPLSARLTPALFGRPLTVEYRLDGVAPALLGEVLGISRVRAAAPFFRLVTGGSGSGRVPAGVWVDVYRLTGELVAVDK